MNKFITTSLILLFGFNILLFSYTYKNVDEIKKDMEEYGNDPIIYTNAGIFYFFEAGPEKDKKKKKEILEYAKKYLEEALKLNPNYNKARSFLGSVYGMLCGVQGANIPSIIHYSKLSSDYLNKSVEKEPFDVDIRLNRIKTFIWFPPAFSKLNQVINDDCDFILSIIEKDAEHRISDYHFKESRSEIYFIKGIVLKRMHDEKKADEMFNKSKVLVDEFTIQNDYNIIYKDCLK